MENLLTIALEAHNDDLNRHRRYEITVGRDLLEDWTLSIRYGRVGSGCQTQRFASSDQSSLRAIICERLRRRRSATRRIGCDYKLRGFDAVAGFDASAWLPDTFFPSHLILEEFPAERIGVKVEPSEKRLHVLME